MRIRNVENYLEVIYDLINEKGRGQARVSDIAENLGIRPSSVTEMIQKLKKEEFVTHKRYGPISLTEKGNALAKRVKKRHQTLKTFLRLLGVKESIAETDACEIEHVVHPETMECLTSFINFLQDTPTGQECLNHLKLFYKKKGFFNEEIEAENTT